MNACRLAATVVLLAAITAAGGLLRASNPIELGATTLVDDGIGPLQLGQPFQQAERLAFRFAPDTAFSGIGCSGQDEVRYDGWMDGHPVSVMAMADAGRIQHIEVTLLQPTRAGSVHECRDLRDRFGEVFVERFGPYARSWQLEKPVSQELLAQAGPVLIVARWFGAGGSCYVSAQLAQANSTLPVGQNQALAAAEAWSN